MGVGGRRQGVGGGPLGPGGTAGGGDLPHGGVVVGLKGPWSELVGPWLSPDVTGHLVPIESGKYPRGLLTRWQLLRRGSGGWSGAPGFLFRLPRVGW